MPYSEDGTYAVQFESNLGLFGAGVVTLDNFVVSGGDSGFLFSGRLVQDFGELTGVITVEQHTKGMTSIFGPLQKFDLNLRGVLKNGHGHFTGEMVGMPQMKLTVRLEQKQRKVA